jgi:hypothetical protein
MSNLVYAENVQYVSNGKFYTGRTNGVGDVGILTPSIKFSGIVGQVKVGEAVAVGDLLYPKTAATPYYMKADPTQAAIKGPANAMALEAATTAGSYVTAIFEGYVKNNAWLTTEYLCSKARATMTSGITVDDEIFTMGSIIFGCDPGADGVAAAAVVIEPASTSQAHWEAAFDKAIVNALAAVVALPAASGFVVETDWAANELDFVAVNAGVAGNLIASTEACTNIAFGATTFTGGTDAGLVYCGDSGKPACLASIPATSNDMVQVVGSAISPTELMFRPILDYDLAS